MGQSSRPVVTHNILTYLAGARDRALRIVVGSTEWFDWLVHNNAFRFEDANGHFSARREVRRGRPYWYAYRRQNGKLANAYLGRTEELREKRLAQVCAALAGQAPAPLNDGAPDLTNASRAALGRVRPPRLPEVLITRPRLGAHMTAPLTLVIAPSGYGKTTLAATWHRQSDFPVAWISFRPEDNQPLRFWSLVFTALQNAPGLDAVAWGSLPLATTADIAPALDRLALELNRRASPLGLIFDDYHHIRQARIHTQLQTWLGQLSTVLRLVIAGRTKPALALGRLRAQGWLSELTVDELRFTLEESQSFLASQQFRKPLTRQEVEILVRRTGGWIAGLNLAALGLNQAVDRHAFIESFGGTHAYIREYFVDSVLQWQSTDVQIFLLKTSILKQLNGELCDALTGFDHGEEMLERLFQENLFLTRTDDPARYQYVELFAEVLQEQLHKRLGDEIPDLHRRAAAWYSQHNAIDEAIYHLITIRAWEEAAALIESVAVRELAQFGEDSRLLRWLRQLPESVTLQHKALFFLYARLSVVALSPAEVDHYLSNVEQSIQGLPVAEHTADVQDVLSEVRRIRPLLAGGAPLTTLMPVSARHDDFWQLLDKVAAVMGPHAVRHMYNDIETLADEVFDTALEQGNLFALLMSMTACALPKFMRGDLREVERRARLTLQVALRKRGKLPEMASISLGQTAQCDYARNHLAQVRRTLDRIAQVDPNPTSTNMLIWAAMMRSKVEFAEGQSAEALATLRTARELQRRRPSGSWLDQDLIAYQAWYLARRGELAQAEELLESGETARTHPLSEVVRAELLLLHGQASVAEAILNHLLSLPSCHLVLEPLLALRILLTIAALKQNDGHRAVQAMAGLVRAAAPENLLRPFLDHGQSIAPLLTLVLHTEHLSIEARGFVESILHRSGTGHPGEIARSSEYRTLSVTASITRREHEVLRLLAAGLSNSEMARQLSVSESTIKTHLGNVYEKLGSNSRGQAAARARSLNLV